MFTQGILKLLSSEIAWCTRFVFSRLLASRIKLAACWLFALNYRADSDKMYNGSNFWGFNVIRTMYSVRLWLNSALRIVGTRHLFTTLSESELSQRIYVSVNWPCGTKRYDSSPSDPWSNSDYNIVFYSSLHLRLGSCSFLCSARFGIILLWLDLTVTFMLRR